MKSSSMQRRQPAQVIALFAIALVAMLAMVGVVVDGGTLYLQRRTAQNAADAAALAGARILQQGSLQNPVPASLDVGTAICDYAHANNFGNTPVPTAYFVNNAGTSVGPISVCSGVADWIPPNTAGVHVDVRIGPYSTYLVGVVGLRQLEADASATAQVGVLGIPGPDLTPLAGCGPDMLFDGKKDTPFDNILVADSNGNLVNIDPARYGDDLVLQGSQMSQHESSSCPKWNGSSSAWKGKIDTSGITGTFTPGTDVPVDTGNGTLDDIIGTMCKNLYGPTHDPNGVGSVPPDVCLLLVPIAAPPNPTDKAHIVTLACFSMYDGGSADNKWRGVLHDSRDCNYGVYVPNWTYGNTNNETRVLLTQ